ncbi:uncharacterized protein STEHIDRAFT_164126 [Stereum hirsutum FP-91666 SS1]|uniref:Uncharacterized protein n=1 Tax=Stereum hirsutum (strain FP-91666) TaxID=721885 RepID=R7RVF4_STEHR|nr:uncharacterized protein STEHIDRAFT_164126 [Stereum hirsutum FP-91666 SS1]EIM78986.1 hypothetical protein STEHIDRAFT_164126 [Stereum hirsutum FP-91666 SS1]
MAVRSKNLAVIASPFEAIERSELRFLGVSKEFYARPITLPTNASTTPGPPPSRAMFVGYLERHGAPPTMEVFPIPQVPRTRKFNLQDIVTASDRAIPLSPWPFLVVSDPQTQNLPKLDQFSFNPVRYRLESFA